MQQNIFQENMMQNYTIIDLTHDVHPDIPTWDLACGYFIKNRRDYHHCDGPVKVREQSFDIRANAGTHIDAQAHFKPCGTEVNQIPLEKLIAPCAMINVAHKADEHYAISVADIQEFEQKYGVIQPSTFVLFHTGWSRFWHEPKKYHNNTVFPHVSEQAAQLLLDRQINGLGIDTFTPDYHAQSSAVHLLLLGANKYLVENVAHADKLPPVGATIFVIPLKLQGAAESPIRLFAMIP